MANMGRVAALAGAGLLISGLTVSAATVSGEDGSVLVNNGAGFVRVLSSTEVTPASQIMVSPGGSALIAYAGNCTVRVPSGVWHVQQASPCAEGATLIDFTTRMNDGAPRPSGDKSFVAPPEERPWLGFVPAAAIGIVAGLCIAETVICEESASGD